MKHPWSKVLAACTFALALATQARADLLTNGSFESGLASWSTSGFQLEGYDFGVDSIAHGGTQAFYGGGITDPGYLFQTISTVAGQAYQVNFWLYSDGYVPNALTLQVGGNTSYSATDVLLQGFTEVQVGFVASSAFTELRFGLRNDSGFLRLDDISVSAVPEPGSVAMFGLGLAALAAFRRRS